MESTGFNDKTWLGPTGYPHSEQMRITERYTRVDHDTIAYDMTITDPMAYTKPIVTPHRIMKLQAPARKFRSSPASGRKRTNLRRESGNPRRPSPRSK